MKIVLFWWFIGYTILLANTVKEKTVKKRPVAVSDPWGLRSLEDWVNLGLVVLKKSCEAANLSPNGSSTTLARRLYHFYQGMATSEQGMRVYNFSSGINCFSLT